jgi:hypothetical protein
MSERRVLSPVPNVPSGAERLLADVRCEIAVMGTEVAVDRDGSTAFAVT